MHTRRRSGVANVRAGPEPWQLRLEVFVGEILSKVADKVR